MKQNCVVRIKGGFCGKLTHLTKSKIGFTIKMASLIIVPNTWKVARSVGLIFVLICVLEGKVGHAQSSRTESTVNYEQYFIDNNVKAPSKNYTFYILPLRQNASTNDSVIQITPLVLKLVPGDRLTFYDGNYTQIIKEYTAASLVPSFSIMSTMPLVQMVFIANTSDSKSLRTIGFLHRAIPKGVCNPIFFGRSGTIASRKHPGFNSCRYTLTVPGLFNDNSIFLSFHKLMISAGEKLILWQAIRSGVFALKPYKPFLVLNQKDSGRPLQLLGPESYGIIFEFNSSTSFNASFKEYKQDKLVLPVSGESGQITLPMYARGRRFDISYKITVPRGGVDITLSDLYLQPREDEIMVFGYYGRKTKLLRAYDNTTKPNTLKLVSTDNSLLVKFVSRYGHPAANFKLVYSIVENEPKPCKKPDLNFVKTSRETAYTGWQQSISCLSGYGNKRGLTEVKATCLTNGSWSYDRKFVCLRKCPPLESLYNLTERGLLTFFEHKKIHYTGDTLTFHCDDIVNHKLDGDRKITCTSSGTYSSSPPSCKDREEFQYWWIILVSVLCVVVLPSAVMAVCIFYAVHLRAKRSRETGGNWSHETFVLQSNGNTMASTTQSSAVAPSEAAEPLKAAGPV